MKSQIDHTRLTTPFIVNCALCRKRIKDVRWEERSVNYGMEENNICISVNCHDRYWSCTFTKTELERKMRSGLIELLAFEQENITKEMEEFNLEKAGLAGSKAGKALRKELIELGNGKLMDQLEKENQK